MPRSPLESEVRKLRKKLRQIEILERSERDLSDEELLKLTRKNAIRRKLQSLLAELKEEEEENFNDSSMLGAEDVDISLESSATTNASYDVSVISNQDVLLLSPQGISQESSFVEHAEESDDGEQENEVSSTHEEFYSKPQFSENGLLGNDDDGWTEVTTRKDLSQGDSPSIAGSKNKKEQISKPVKTSSQVLLKKSEPNSDQPTKAQVNKPSDQPTKAQVSKPSKTAAKLKAPAFKDKSFNVISLEGHNDLITALDSDGQYLISGGRDTTLRYWDVARSLQLRSFGGHTGTVTSVVLLNQTNSEEFCKQFDEDTDLPLDDPERIAFSGSTDCSIKLWALESGQQMKNIYTFNPITNLQYMVKDKVLIASTAGGKIDVWDPYTGQNVLSTIAHKDSITCLKVENNVIYSSSVDGEIQIHHYKDKSLRRIYLSETMKLTSGGTVLCRPIRSLAFNGDLIYYGDDGSNVKILDWKKGEVDKVSNHLCEFGSTDAAVVFDGVLYTSGYDIDNGFGYINCRNASTKQYMGTLCDEESGCILTICCIKNISGKRVIIAAGDDLKLWVECTAKDSSSDDEVVQPYFIKQYDKAARHSDIESEGDSDYTEEEQEDEVPVSPFKRKNLDNLDDEKQYGKSWFSWCTVL